MTAAVVALLAANAAGTWSIHAGGGLAFEGTAFTATTTFTQFAEQGTITARHQPGSGPLLEVGLRSAVSPRLGVELTFDRSERDTAATFTAALPHPLFLGRHRTADGTLRARAQRETALHFTVDWTLARGGFTVRIGGGPSYMLAEADLVESVILDEAYPYDTVTITGVRASGARGDALGGHAMLTLERRLSRHLALGAGARWSRASVALLAGGAENGRTASLRVGGLAASGSLRLYF